MTSHRCREVRKARGQLRLALVAMSATLLLGRVGAQNINTPAPLLRGVTITDDHDIRDTVSITLGTKGADQNTEKNTYLGWVTSGLKELPNSGNPAATTVYAARIVTSPQAAANATTGTNMKANVIAIANNFPGLANVNATFVQGATAAEIPWSGTGDDSELIPSGDTLSYVNVYSDLHGLQTTDGASVKLMAMPSDSSSMGCLSPVENWARWYGYVANLGGNVDIWEIGNEINGSWVYSSVGAYPTKGEYGAQPGSVPGCNSGWGVNPSGQQWYATTDFAGNAIQWKSKGSGKNKYEYPVTTPDTIVEMLADSYLIVKTANVGNKVALTLTYCPSDNSIDGGGVNGLNETNNWLQNFVLGQGSTGKTLTSINDLNVMTTYGGAPGGTYSNVLPFSQGVDYVIVSYYSWYDGSSGCSGNPEIWASNPNLVDLMFDNLHTVFPNAKLGWGEFGSSQANELGSTTTTKAASGAAGDLVWAYSYYPSLVTNHTNVTPGTPAAWAGNSNNQWIGGVFFWNWATQALAWDTGYPTYSTYPASGTKVPGGYTPITKNLCVADTSECDGNLGSVSHTTTSSESVGGVLACALQWQNDGTVETGTSSGSGFVGGALNCPLP